MGVGRLVGEQVVDSLTVRPSFTAPFPLLAAPAACRQETALAYRGVLAVASVGL
jgi:hypothetical protein